MSLAIGRLAIGKAAVKAASESEAKGASAFFATIAFHLKLVQDESVGTAAVDGTHLFYSPKFVSELQADQAVGLVVHEVMHVANKHHCRMGLRDPDKWNIAADLSINPLIKQSGIELPAKGLFPGEPPFGSLEAGLSAEAYYTQLPPMEKIAVAGRGNKKDMGGCGGVISVGKSEADAAEAEGKVNVLLGQAKAIAKMRGTLPASMDRWVTGQLAPVVDWRRVLAEFLSRPAKVDYLWTRPNRRFVHAGLYLPSFGGSTIGDVVIAVDTSGSIGAEALNRFASESQGILDAFECRVVILYHDASVASVQEWQSSDGPLQLKPKGGGGTSHVCVFNWLKQHPEVDPACVVCLTDLYTEFPEAPDLPVLWCVHQGPSDPKPPFGQWVVIP
jgi:predicted metal-dependent peptidase